MYEWGALGYKCSWGKKERDILICNFSLFNSPASADMLG